MGAAIYLEEYADRDRWYNRLIEVNIQNLAAVPSIVYGILGPGVPGPGSARPRPDRARRPALTLSLLVLPDRHHRLAGGHPRRAPTRSVSASLALGATQWQTIRRQVLPAAIPGIATGSILALSRAIGEAAPLLLLGGAHLHHLQPRRASTAPSPCCPSRSSTGSPGRRRSSGSLAAAAIVVLLVILLVMNSLAIWLRNHYRRRW